MTLIQRLVAMLQAIGSDMKSVLPWADKSPPVGDVVGTMDSQTLSNKTVVALTVQKSIQFTPLNLEATTATTNVVFSSSQKVHLTLRTNTTVNFSFPGPGNYQLLLIQDSTGGRSAAINGVGFWLSATAQPPINLAPNSRSVASVYFDGTSVHCGLNKFNAIQAMPTVSAYPNAVKLASDFASAANVVGNTTAYATHNGIKAVGQVIFAEYGFDLSAVPANALIDRIRFNVIAKANAAGRRTARWIDVQHANGGGFNTTSTPGVPLQGADTTATIVLDRVADAALWAQMQMTTAAVRDPATRWGVGFESTIASTTLTSWQKFWLDVDYTLPAAGVPNLLFMNELF